MSRTRTAKLQRWIDLIAALLRRRYRVTFEELMREVPAYAKAPGRAALMRMFERDKDELRALGIPIETLFENDGESAAYRLRRRDFYLPYLTLAKESGAERGPGPERPGYRDLPRIVIDAGEVAAIDQAAIRVRQLGDPVLAAEAESAIHKLAFDLPPGTFGSVAPCALVRCRAQVEARVFELLDLALRQRKRVSFAYHRPDRRGAERREVEPYGLFFLGGLWYLAARDPIRDAIRRFRLDRMDDLAVNTRREQSPDYEVPADFDLRELARWRWPWELGHGDAIEATVVFRSGDGATAAALRIGEPAGDDELTRRYRVHRLPSFARWLAALGGDAVPISPPELVSAVRDCVRETLAVYRRRDGHPERE